MLDITLFSSSLFSLLEYSKGFITPMRNTPGCDNPRSVSACVPEAFCTINLHFVMRRSNVYC